MTVARMVASTARLMTRLRLDMRSSPDLWSCSGDPSTPHDARPGAPSHDARRRDRDRGGGSGGDGGESNSPSKTLRRRPLRACPMVCRRPSGRTSAPCRTVQSRVPRSGLTPDYASLVRIAASLDDASTTRKAEVASTLTLPPKRRERESTGGCQVLRFAALLTGPEQHPRLALPDSQALSKPRIPTGPNVGSEWTSYHQAARAPRPAPAGVATRTSSVAGGMDGRPQVRRTGSRIEVSGAVRRLIRGEPAGMTRPDR